MNGLQRRNAMVAARNELTTAHATASWTDKIQRGFDHDSGHAKGATDRMAAGSLAREWAAQLELDRWRGRQTRGTDRTAVRRVPVSNWPRPRAEELAGRDPHRARHTRGLPIAKRPAPATKQGGPSPKEDRKTHIE